MIEVEIRAKVTDFNNIKKELTKLGSNLITSEEQIDKIFGHERFLDSNKMIVEGGISSRIRKVNNQIALEFKEISRQGIGMEISSDVDSIDLGVKFLEKLGFKEAFTISKIRENYNLNGFTVSLDKVDKLGSFIEVEKLITSIDNKEEVKKECIDLLKKIAPESEIENRKYGDLMQELINKETTKMKIFIAGSMSFAKEFVETKKILEELGFLAEFAPDTHDCLNNPHLKLNEDLEHCEKTDIMRACMDIQKDCDAILVLNYPKQGFEGYIGTHSLIELGFAYYLNQKIFLLYPPPNQEKARYHVEIMHMKPIILNGDLSKIS